MKRKTTVQAMLDTDLEKLLIQSNQLNEFIEGEIKCCMCGRVITSDNISMLLPVEQEDKIKFKFICSDIECNSKY